MRINNYVGHKIEMLYVMEKTDKKDKYGRVLYKCICDCGNIVFYNSSDLYQNVSCGCYRKANRQFYEKTMLKMQYVDNTSLSLIKEHKLNSNNTSGFRGVSYDKTRKKWKAYIKLQYKMKLLGRFDTFEKAVKARLDAEKRYYKPIIEKYDNKIKADIPVRRKK